MKNFSLPGMYEHHEINFKFLDFMRENPDFFIDNVGVDAIYGNFQFCTWDGGRVFPSEDYRQVNKEDIQFIVDKYNNEFDVPVRMIFTNNQLTQADYENRFCNLILELCHNDKNQIVVADNNLKNYIKDRYPNYKFISSTTKCLTNLKNAEQEILNDEFFEVCLDYNLNHNFTFLDSLSEDAKNKVEFLCNAICPPACPYRKEHYKLNSLSMLQYGREYCMPECGINYSCTDPRLKNTNTNNIDIDEIINVYEPMGFSHFKLEGRTFDAVELIGNYALYMIKPEYRVYAISRLMRKF